MEEKLSELYSMLANQIASMIPGGWDNVNYLGEVSKERKSWSSVFYYTDIESGQIVKSHDIPGIYKVSKNIYRELLRKLDNLLLELYECFKENERELWEQISFSLSKEGKFNVDFYYDVMIEEGGGQVEREVLWAHNTFGFLPKEGTYSRMVLDDHLKERTVSMSYFFR